MSDAEHLSGFDCPGCGHSGVAHYRNPGCRSCRCSADPQCWCGLLASKHLLVPTEPDHCGDPCPFAGCPGCEFQTPEETK